MNTLWIILAVVAVTLWFFSKPPNSIGGGITIGIVVGFIWATIYYFVAHRFSWLIIFRCIVAFMLMGTITDYAAIFFNRKR